MELGLTFPLQRFLRCPTPPYGTEALRFCWDLHVIDLRRRRSLLAVHAESRYTLVRCDLTAWEWQDLPSLVPAMLAESLGAVGTEAAVSAYLRTAGRAVCTRTHGRRPVAFLNRAWEDVLALDVCLDTSDRPQPLLETAVNNRLCRCAGFDGLGTAAERMASVLRAFEK